MTETPADSEKKSKGPALIKREAADTVGAHLASMTAADGSALDLNDLLAPLRSQHPKSTATS